MTKHITYFFMVIIFLFCLQSCGSDENVVIQEDQQFVQPEGDRYSEIFTGGMYHLGPVDWEESEWTNAFGPYPEEIQEIEGNDLAGLELEHNGGGEICDACIKINTEAGKSLILRVVTTGVTTKNSIDVSPEAYEKLNSGEWPRDMSWYVTKCPDNGENIIYQFKTGSNPWWAVLWVRNPALPILSVEVKNDNHTDWFKMVRASDGSYVDNKGFGSGSFTLKVTAIDGQVIEETFNSYTPGGLLRSSGQF